MAATPPSLTTPPPPPPPTDHTHPSFLSHQEYSDIFSYLPSTMPNDTQNGSGGFGVDGALPNLPPPPPASADANGAVQSPPPVASQAQNGNDQERGGDREHGESGSDDGEDDSEDGEGDHSEMDRSWYSIFEEKREPVDDELRYWKETKEHSAEDDAYWKGKAFTDLQDPELQPGESGRIDLAIDRFNGTREKPNKEMVMRSEIVKIGGYDWRLKFYPKGNNTDHLSVYIENVTMQAAEWEGTEDFTDPPLPFLSSCKERPRKRRCVSAQVCTVLYNPSEPRQYEHRLDAHQFTKESPDYGWTRFTHMRRRDLGLRNHFQRAPLLQDDKLALKAYIRVVDDPTGCLWDHGPSKFPGTIASTGLRPFARMLPILAADVVLLHFRPFQKLVSKWQQDKDVSKFASWMNIMLWKMLSRERSEMYGSPIDCEQSDAIAWLQRAVKYVQQEEGSETAQRLLGSLDGTAGAAIGVSRLKTRTNPSVQAALDAHDSTLHTSALLTLELERQHFDREKREWKRINNKVDIQNEVVVGDERYKLFAFITQCGELSSNNFKTYVRPHGPGGMWYGYSHDRVTCMTHKQALGKRCGRDEVEVEKRERSLSSYFGRDPRGMQLFRDDQEVAYVVFYVREDYTDVAFAQLNVIDWEPPAYVKEGKAVKEPSSAQNGSTVIEEKEVPQDAPQDQAAKRTSIASNGSDYNSGCATPAHWFMDEDGDVVMSDNEDVLAEKSADVETTTKAEPKESDLVHRTIDHLGCPYYSGQMLGSQYHGQGHLIALTGDEYTGTFSRNRQHGTGQMTYAANGDVYAGEWAHGERHGRGTYTEASTKNVFDGSWKHDKKTGNFVLTGTVTEEDRGVCGICYEREMNTAFYDCGHVVACFACAQQIEDCPVCRRRIVSRLQLFGVRVSLE